MTWWRRFVDWLLVEDEDIEERLAELEARVLRLERYWGLKEPEDFSGR